MTQRTEPVAYVRWAALVTAFLYTAGYSTIGFGFLFFGALWRLLIRRPPLWQSTPLDRPLAAFGAILVLSAIFSPYLRLASGVTLMLLLSGAVYLGSFGWLLHRDPGSRMTLLRAWALGAPPAALVGLAVSALTHERASIPRGVGPNGLGTTLLLGSILVVGLAIRARGWERVFWLASSLVTLLGLLASGSRASLVGFVVGVSYLVWRELHAHPWKMAAALAIGAVVLVLAAAFTPQLSARVGNTMTDVSTNRLKIWPASLRMIGAHPVLGTGFGTFERAYEGWKAPEMPPEPFAFNLALNIAVEIGLAGLIAALWVAVTGVDSWVRSGRSGPPGADPARAVITALWIGLLVNQLADNTLFSISTSAGLWLLLAFLVVPCAPIHQPETT